MFHVLGRWYGPPERFFWPLLSPAFACFVCCIIWLIRSSCCFVSPSFPPPPPPLLDEDDDDDEEDELLLLQPPATMTGELGADGDDEADEEEGDADEAEDDMLLVPSPLKGAKVAPCGELASPVTTDPIRI